MRLYYYYYFYVLSMLSAMFYDDDDHCCHKMIFELNLGWTKDKWSNRDILAGKIGIFIRKYYSIVLLLHYNTASSRCITIGNCST